jgi:tryptophanase/molybdopterin/thiamine biosynthesis adenylyltransferase
MSGSTETRQTESVPVDWFEQYLHRTISLLGAETVEALRGKTVAVSGCGGHGGAAAITLARMGVEGFVLADPNAFDEPDINRQWAANRTTLGRNKAQVYAEVLSTINPGVRVRVHDEGVTAANLSVFLDGADYLVDCLDIAVPVSLRTALFREAQGRGIHAATGANLGFGGMIAAASPDGVPLEVLSGIEDDATQNGAIPPLFHRLFVPRYLHRIEQSLHLHRVPSVAIAPALLGALLATECVATLLGATLDGWRPPVCLPRLLLVDLLRMSYRVVHLDELRTRPAQAAPDPSAPRAALGLPDPARRSHLIQAGWNANLVPEDGVAVDLATDSWAEIGVAGGPAPEPVQGLAAAEDLLRGLYGYEHTVPVFRGRFAEALLARTLAGRPGIVVTNSLFPTTRFHLESAGLRLLDLSCPQSRDRTSLYPFKGNLDLDALDALLAGPQGSQPVAVYLELCVNAIGGHPVSLAHLDALRERLAARGIPLGLDATRAYENAALLLEREPGLAGRSLAAVVRGLCDRSDFCAASATKDFGTPIGGFVATRDRAQGTALRDLALAHGDGLDPQGRRTLAQALADYGVWNDRCQDRVRQVQGLWGRLLALGVPLECPAGGHGIFVDARAMLPHLPPDRFPAQSLANALYLRGGVRGAPGLSSPHQAESGIELLRLAVPIGRYSDTELDAVVEAFAALLPEAAGIGGLALSHAPPGVSGALVAAYEPWA